MRSGHTEAAVDLCRLAGLPPVGVICELANDDGTVMKGAQIDAFAQKHRLEAHLGRRSHRLSPGAREARRARRHLPGQDRVRRASPAMPTRRPSTACSTSPSSTARIGDGTNVPVRLHRANVVADIFGGGNDDQAALKRFAKEGRGVLVYLRDGTAGVPTHATLSGHEECGFGGPALDASGAKSGSARRSCATSASPRSATSRPRRRGPMWASPASASRSSPRSRWSFRRWMTDDGRRRDADRLPASTLCLLRGSRACARARASG